MMENTTISITFNGEIDNDNVRWIQWYNDAKKIVKLLGYEPTHVGISGTAFKSGKVLSVSKSEKKILKSLENGDSVYYISLFALPKDYKSASFDYDVLVWVFWGSFCLSPSVFSIPEYCVCFLLQAWKVFKHSFLKHIFNPRPLFSL